MLHGLEQTITNANGNILGSVGVTPNGLHFTLQLHEGQTELYNTPSDVYTVLRGLGFVWSPWKEATKRSNFVGKLWINRTNHNNKVN